VEKTARKVMACGKISTEKEYETLVELETDQSLLLLSSEEMAQIGKLLRDFEERA